MNKYRASMILFSAVSRFLIAACCAHLVAACTPLVPVASRVTGAPSTGALTSRIAAMAKGVDPHMHFGMMVVEATDGASVIEVNSSEIFVPASTLKLFTAAAALSALGPTYRFNTELLVEQVPNSTCKIANLYLRGSGDPGLRQQDIAALVEQLRQRGIQEITGALVLDETVFDSVRWGHAWAWDDRDEDYSAPVEGLNLESNTIELTAVGASVPGGPGRIRMSPETPYACILNQTLTALTSGVGPVTMEVVPRDDVTGLVEGQCIRVNGVLGVDEVSSARHFAVHDGALFVASAVTDALLRQGIKFSGVVQRGSTPPAAEVIASHASAPLAALLVSFIKESDNHGMECLVKRIGAQSIAGSGTWSNGLQIIRRVLEDDFGLASSTLLLLDGSGLSRKNLASPSDLVAVLRRMYGNPELGPEYLAMLPLAGVDGTLARRFVGSPLWGRLSAKTGTMDGISNLAGLITVPGQSPLIFSIMMNNFVGPVSRYRQLQEDILRVVYEYQRPKE